MERYLCDLCDNPIKITHSEFLIKCKGICDNGHENNNVSFKNYRLNESLFKCQEHKNYYNIAYCFICKKEICLSCTKDHKNHKFDYLYNLRKDVSIDFKAYNIINDLKEINNCFFIELDNFKTKNNININFNSLKSLIEREYNILFTIINSKRIKINDIENIKFLFNSENFKTYINILNTFFSDNIRKDNSFSISFLSNMIISCTSGIFIVNNSVKFISFLSIKISFIICISFNFFSI